MREEWADIGAAAAACAGASVWALSDGEVIEALRAVHAARQVLCAAELHLVQQMESRNVASTQAATSTANWLRWHLRVGAGAARRLVDEARMLDTRPALDEALMSARMNDEQVAVVGRCVEDLRRHADVPAALVDEAEAVLIGWAPDLDPAQLRRAAARVLEHVAPELAEQVELDALRRADRRAERDRYVTLSPLGDGRVRLHGLLSTPAAATLSAALDPLCAPRTARGPDTPHAPTTAAAPGVPRAVGAPRAVGVPRAVGDSAVSRAAPDLDATSRADATRGGPGSVATSRAGAHPADRRTPGQRRADALIEVCELALRTAELPANGGDRPQMAVTVPFDVLNQKLGIGTLDSGERVHPETVRRLACDARLLPVVLGGEAQVLEAGRARRLATGALRRALVVRDRGCTFPGCDRPPRWCEGHHLVHWADGGPTNLTNMALLCGYHHRLVHREGWQVRLGPDARPEFTPPPHLDDQHQPRRNHYPLRT
ncbi:HNH endonuclease signature motif containing protein [Mangrovihabitans endophyticus]|uniref:HNH nuclease domain-containing protein n=1 Tax=Mangrovihabitans endophyticus TaxID=1751298 RepID=A0A8J3C5F0_9ACTN|nr:HNH endonuclease signature motif containing protein [Mangrovihabitans endophyticus]GGL13128.1 hypothetical protein GCM10012284_54730 [Mangrovihabitans endophyticus]